MTVQQPRKYNGARSAMLRADARLRADLKIAAAIDQRAISDITEEALREWLLKSRGALDSIKPLERSRQSEVPVIAEPSGLGVELREPVVR